MTTPQSSGARTTEGARLENRPQARTSTSSEAKEGFKTSEFYVMVIFVAGVLIATYADNDSLSHEDGFRYAAIAVAAYVVSRGLAKLGVRDSDRND